MKCKEIHGTAAEHRLVGKMDKMGNAIQSKIEQLIHDTGLLVGKISVLEKTLNGKRR